MMLQSAGTGDATPDQVAADSGKPGPHPTPGETVPDPGNSGHRRRLRAFQLLLLLGFAARVIAGVYSTGFHHPDEHQQYLERAQGLVYGYYMHTWEHDYGARHILLPALLAGILATLERTGLGDPLVQASIIRCCMGVAIFAAFAALAWDRFRDDPTAGLALAFLAAVNAEFLFYSVRTLSETAMTLVLLLAIHACERQRYTLAGILLGLMFGLRFHSGFLVAGMVGIAGYDFLESRRHAEPQPWWKQPLIPLTVGLAASLLLVGGIDRLMWGTWFQTPLRYFHRNVHEGFAASFGTMPWYGYLIQVGGRLLEYSPLLPILPVFMLIGCRREPRLALLAGAFLVPHSLVGHKEFRFVFPLMPIGMILASAGFADVCRWANRRTRPWLLPAAMAVSLMAGCCVTSYRLAWKNEPTTSCAIALHRCGELPDLRGLAVHGVPKWNCGNYFYLRRNVPLLVFDRIDPARMDSAIRADPEINYLITPVQEIRYFAEYEPMPVSAAGLLGVFRLGSRNSPKNSVSHSHRPGDRTSADPIAVVRRVRRSPRVVPAGLQRLERAGGRDDPVADTDRWQALSQSTPAHGELLPPRPEMHTRP